MQGERRIVLALQDAAECRRLVAQLAGCGFGVVAPEGMAALGDLMAEQRPRIAAMLVDADFAGQDAAATCAALRRAGRQFPVLVLHDPDTGGRSAHAAIVRCLDAGANDCMVRPLRPLELAARLRAQLRQHDGSAGAELGFGPYRFRPSQREVEEVATGRIIRLTATEAAMLRFLHGAGGAAVPRAVLLDQVWGYRANVTTHTVETHIYRLRRKIEPERGRPLLLLSDEAGYRLNMVAGPVGHVAVPQGRAKRLPPGSLRASA
ncbi:MAG: response regulator transcription factor [Acetobacteraceae bacterium]|nr:response regulator transcription factor [Acetobacteraceae bacterium]